MQKTNYIYQKFLLNCDYEKLNLSDYSIRLKPEKLDSIKEWDVQYNIFDCDVPYERKLNLSYLDEHIDTEEDWQNFLIKAKELDKLYIIDDRPSVESQILQDYQEATKKAYIYRMNIDDVKFVLCA